MGRSRVKKIRILLANRPRMMREVLRKVFECQEDLEVVGEVLDPSELLVALRETETAALILGLTGSEEPGLCSQLLAKYPNLSILGLTAAGETAFVEQLCLRHRELRNPCGAEILSAIREAIGARCNPEKDVTPDQRQQSDQRDNFIGSREDVPGRSR
jgi:DNA-binding NarL/FixJ family response regulator